MMRPFQATPGGLRCLLLMTCWFALSSSIVETILYPGSGLPRRFEILIPAAMVNLALFIGIALIFALLARTFRSAKMETIFVGAVGVLFGFFLVRKAFIAQERHLLTLTMAIACSVGSMFLFQRLRIPVLSLQRHSLPWLFAFVVLVAAGCKWWEIHDERQTLASLSPAALRAPNVLLVIVDALRADHLSAYGYSRHTTPFIDKLTSEGVVFDAAVAPSSWTLPSHVSMMTGRYPQEHKVDGVDKIMDGSLPTLGERFETNGYKTGGFSANTTFFSRRNGFARGFHHFEDVFQTPGSSVVTTFWGKRIQETLRPFRGAIQKELHRDIENHLWRIRATDVNARVLRWLDTTPESPFFITMNYLDVHGPYALPSEAYGARFSDSPPGVDSSENERFISLGRDLLEDINTYDGNVSYVDDSLHALLNELTRRGKLENTIVIITSDHGESFGEHGLVTHMNGLYFETLHVPLIFWGPRYIPAFRRVSTPISLCSLPATVLDLVRIDSAAFQANPSLVPLWRDPERQRAWPTSIAEIQKLVLQGDAFQQSSPAAEGYVRSAIGPEWQYIEYEHRGAELFRWRTDKKELHNQINAEPSTVAAMKTALRQPWIGDATDLRQNTSGNNEHPGKKQKHPTDDLGGLGYVQ